MFSTTKAALFDDFIQLESAEKNNIVEMSPHQQLISRGQKAIADLLKQHEHKKRNIQIQDVSHQVFPTSITLKYFILTFLISCIRTDYSYSFVFSLNEMEMFGFDYDYTLAEYTEDLQPLIYSMALQYMVDTMRFVCLFVCLFV
jgi:hypothetical protein